MRAFLTAIMLALAGTQIANAGPQLAGKTNMSFDPGHGTQIEYLQSGGASFLWYPGNAVVLPGRWKMEGATSRHPAQLCFRYGPNTYNPVTHVYGDVWECETTAVYYAVLAEQATGDVFGLAKLTRVPFVLRSGRTTLEQLENQAGVRANLRSTR